MSCQKLLAELDAVTLPLRVFANIFCKAEVDESVASWFRREENRRTSCLQMFVSQMRDNFPVVWFGSQPETRNHFHTFEFWFRRAIENIRYKPKMDDFLENGFHDDTDGIESRSSVTASISYESLLMDALANFTLTAAAAKQLDKFRVKGRAIVDSYDDVGDCDSLDIDEQLIDLDCTKHAIMDVFVEDWFFQAHPEFHFCFGPNPEWVQPVAHRRNIFAIFETAQQKDARDAADTKKLEALRERRLSTATAQSKGTRDSKKRRHL